MGKQSSEEGKGERGKKKGGMSIERTASVVSKSVSILLSSVLALQQRSHPEACNFRHIEDGIILAGP